MKREIARVNEVTSVEYVRCLIVLRYAIGRLRALVYTRISQKWENNRPKAGLFFRYWPDTHGCVYENPHPYAMKKRTIKE